MSKYGVFSGPYLDTYHTMAWAQPRYRIFCIPDTNHSLHLYDIRKTKCPANEFDSFVASFRACNLQINWHVIWSLSLYLCATALNKRKHQHIILILLLACILLTKSFLENVKRTALLRHESISFVKEYQLLTNLITWDCYFLHIFFWKI